jgi:hypothetical protein
MVGAIWLDRALAMATNSQEMSEKKVKSQDEVLVEVIFYIMKIILNRVAKN